MNYKLLDIDEMDIDYTFTAAELQDVDVMDMINLQDRGGYSSTYHLPLTGLEVGKRIAIRNRDFGLSSTHKYTGVRMVLRNDDPTLERQDYWFCFENQWASFLFDGQGWVLLSEPPLPLCQPNFIKEQDVVHGYVDIKEYLDPLKAVWFKNLDMSGFDVNNIGGRFFRQGTMGTLQEDAFVEHTHKEKLGHHMHNFTNTSNIFPLERILKDIIGQKNKYPKKVRNWFEAIMKSTDSKPLKVFEMIERIKTTIGPLHPKVLEFLTPLKEDLFTKLDKDQFIDLFLSKDPRGLDFADTVMNFLLKEIDKLIAALESAINNSWDELVALMNEYMPDSPLTDLVNTLGEGAKQILLDFIENNKEAFKKWVAEELPNYSGFLKVVSDINNFVNDNFVVVDSSLTVCEKSDKKNVPVYRLISNTKLSDMLAGKKKSNISMLSLVSDIFTIETTSETTLNILENADGLTETRPHSIQGQYIIKCY